MRVLGIAGLSRDQIETELLQGGRFVHYEYCLSLIFLTWRRPTSVRLLRGRQNGFLRSLPWSLLTLALGWWGVPWGLLYTPAALYTNLAGGRIVTRQVMRALFPPPSQAAPDGTDDGPGPLPPDAFAPGLAERSGAIRRS